MTGIFIGYPKSGSTTIQQWLSSHPQIDYHPHGNNYQNVPNGKFTVIGDEGLAIPFPSFEQISQSDVDAVIAEMRDGTALRDKQTQVCQTLATQYPQAKVLIVTRAAVSLMRSIYLDYIKFGGTRRFKQYTGECEPYFRTWLDYDFLTALYRQHFGPGQVLPLPCELLFANPSQFWQLLGEFWQAEAHAEGAAKALNQALYQSSTHLVRRISSGVKQLLRPFPVAWRRAAWRRYAYSFLAGGGLSAIEKFQRRTPAAAPGRVELAACAGWQTAEKLAQTNIYQPFKHLYTTQPKPANPRPIFQDPQLQARLDATGYVIIDFLTSAEVSRLHEFAAGLLQDWDGTGVYTSNLAADRETNYKFDALLKAIAARKVNELTIACYLHGGSYLIKGNSGETIFRMHQDWNNVDETQAMSYALWIPLADTYGTDGGLCVVPQSHKIFPGAIRSPTNPSLALDFTDDLTQRLKPLYIKAGQACIYAHNLFHGSRYNTSGALRPVIHAGIFPCEAQQVHYFVNGSTVEEVAVGSEFYYAQLPAMLKGQKPPEFPVNKTFPLLPEHSPRPEDFYRVLEERDKG